MIREALETEGQVLTSIINNAIAANPDFGCQQQFEEYIVMSVRFGCRCFLLVNEENSQVVGVIKGKQIRDYCTIEFFHVDPNLPNSTDNLERWLCELIRELAVKTKTTEATFLTGLIMSSNSTYKNLLSQIATEPFNELPNGTTEILSTVDGIIENCDIWLSQHANSNT